MRVNSMPRTACENPFLVPMPQEDKVEEEARQGGMSEHHAFWRRLGTSALKDKEDILLI